MKLHGPIIIIWNLKLLLKRKSIHYRLPPTVDSCMLYIHLCATVYAVCCGGRQLGLVCDSDLGAPLSKLRGNEPALRLNGPWDWGLSKSPRTGNQSIPENPPGQWHLRGELFGVHLKCLISQVRPLLYTSHKTGVVQVLHDSVKHASFFFLFLFFFFFLFFLPNLMKMECPTLLV